MNIGRDVHEGWMEVIMTDDHELLCVLKQNPENGVRQLMGQYAGLVYSVISGRAGSVATVQDLEECVSDVIFEVFQNRDRIDLNKGSLKAFIAVVARKRAINLFNKKMKEIDRASPTEYIGGAENAAYYEDDIIKKEEHQFLIDSVKSLGEPDSSIVFRKYYFGQKSKEIAADLGMTTGAVDTRLSRAVNKLRDLMGGRD